MRHMKNYLNLEYLNTFVTAAETGKLNQAAELTFRSHSAVSIQIKKLEEQLETPLFLRNKNSLTLTRGGEILLDYARQLLALHEGAFKSLTGKTWDGVLVIGVPTDYASEFIKNLYPAICSQLPQFQIRVEFTRSRRIRDEIRERKIDFGIVAMEPQYPEDVMLWEERLFWVCADSFEQTAKYLPVALFSDDCVINTYSLACLKKANVPFQIIFTSTMMDNIVSCVESGSAVSLLPESFITENMSRIPECELPCPFTLKIGCTWNENTDRSALTALLEIAQDFWGDKAL